MKCRATATGKLKAGVARDKTGQGRLILKTHAQRIVDTLRTRILAGTLRGGDRLEEARLCEEFGVSRSPVRDALTHLEAQGLLKRIGRRGAEVQRPGHDEFLKIHEVHLMLEAQSAGLAARRITREDGKALESAMQACLDHADTSNSDTESDRYAELNSVFHLGVLRASGNDFLHELCNISGFRIYDYLRAQFLTKSAISLSASEHKAICAAILDNDSAQASSLMHAHVSLTPEKVADIFSAIDRRDLVKPSALT